MIGLLLLLAGCGPSVECADPGTVLDGELTCAQAQVVPAYVEALAGRPLARGDERLALQEIVRRYQADPAGVTTWLAEVEAAAGALRARSGLSLAEARSARVWAADAGKDLVRPDMGDLWNVQQRALSVWTKDDEEQLALTEADLEAWIRYASLCREVQGGAVLRISVADRVTVYRVLIDRFQAADRGTQVAMSALGPHWNQVRDAWKSASYDEQQEWVGLAPLPPPMTATSLGYAEAVFQGDLRRHAEILHEQLGPFGIPE